MTSLCDQRVGKKKRFVTRRDFWCEAGMGVGGLALAYLMNKDGLLAAEPPSIVPGGAVLTSRSGDRIALPPQAAALQAAGEVSHPPLHERWRQPCGQLRLQAGAVEVPWGAAHRQGGDSCVAGLSRASDEEPVRL